MTKLIISTPTIEDWRAVMRKLFDEGCKWSNGGKGIHEDYFDSDGVQLYVEENRLSWSEIKYHEENNEEYKDYKFLTAQEFLGEEREFKVRDKVECVKEYENVEIGMKGKIISISDNSLPIGVEWEKDINGHNCEGCCKNGYGYYVKEENIQLLKEDPKREEIITPEGNISRWYLVSKDVRKLIKAGLIDRDNLLLTDECKEELWTILFEEKKAELVKLAEEKITEMKEEEEEE